MPPVRIWLMSFSWFRCVRYSSITSASMRLNVDDDAANVSIACDSSTFGTLWYIDIRCGLTMTKRPLVWHTPANHYTVYILHTHTHWTKIQFRVSFIFTCALLIGLGCACFWLNLMAALQFDCQTYLKILTTASSSWNYTKWGKMTEKLVLFRDILCVCVCE